MISKFAAITSLEDKYNWAAGSEGSYSKGGCLDDMKVSAKHQLYQLYESIIPQLNYFSEFQDIIYRQNWKLNKVIICFQMKTIGELHPAKNPTHASEEQILPFKVKQGK